MFEKRNVLMQLYIINHYFHFNKNQIPVVYILNSDNVDKVVSIIIKIRPPKIIQGSIRKRINKLPTSHIIL